MTITLDSANALRDLEDGGRRANTGKESTWLTTPWMVAWRNVLTAALLALGGCATQSNPPAVASKGGEPAATVAVGKPRSDLIPRAVLFGNPERRQVQVSPDGRWISWHAPREGVLNVWVATANALASARPVTSAKTHPISEAHWTFDGKHLVYLQDEAGDERFHVYRVAVETGDVVDLTPLKGVTAAGFEVSPRKPNTILVLLNDRDESVFDLHAIDLTTGKRRLVARNDHEFVDWVVDRDLRPRFAQTVTETGALAWMIPDGKRWRHYDETPAEDVLNSGVLGFDAGGTSYYTVDSRGRDTAALFMVDAKTKKKRLVHADERADLDGWDLLIHPTEMTVQAVAVHYDKSRWVVLDPRVAKDLDALAELADGFPHIASRTLDDSTWIVAFESDVRSIQYYRWDRKTQVGELLFAEHPELDRQPLVRMHPVTIEARDGLRLVSYLSLPKHADPDGDGKANRSVPMVLLVHGGPAARDYWGFNSYHQLFANRGYAVLSVNFRGSTGFGKAFANAGNRQWGREMHDDLLDAVTWAVEHGVTERDQVCVFGASYGGYAVLAGLTLTPNVFACGVDEFGASSLVTLFDAISPRELASWRVRLGDPSTPEGRQALLDVSPLTHVARITRPLLIGQGANDATVKKSESDQMVSAMQARGVPVSYVVFPDEGHGFQRPENNQAFLALVEAFFSVHIGGWYQPISESELAASSMSIEAGRRWLPGLPGDESCPPPRKTPRTP